MLLIAALYLVASTGLALFVGRCMHVGSGES